MLFDDGLHVVDQGADIGSCGAATVDHDVGMPVGHFLPLTKHTALVGRHVDDEGRLQMAAAKGDPIWREEQDVEEVTVEESTSKEAEWVTAVFDLEHEEKGEADGGPAQDQELDS